MQLSKERIGKFTASEGWKLWPGVRGGMSTRNTYIFEKAVELTTGQQKQFSNKHTDHGHMHEHDGILNFAEISGLNVESLLQEYFPINEFCGATPDAKVVDFSGVIVASCDLKCPTTTFFEQKMALINEAKPEYQNCTKEMFVQGQIQMLALTEYNKKLGHPPVEKHYLVRYLTAMDTDYYGNTIEYDLPLEARIFWKEITAEKKWQDEFLAHVDQASKEQIAIAKILKQPII